MAIGSPVRFPASMRYEFATKTRVLVCTGRKRLSLADYLAVVMRLVSGSMIVFISINKYICSLSELTSNTSQARVRAKVESRVEFESSSNIAFSHHQLSFCSFSHSHFVIFGQVSFTLSRNPYLYGDESLFLQTLYLQEEDRKNALFTSWHEYNTKIPIA